MLSLRTIKARYTAAFIGFVLLVMLLTMLGIKRFVTPQLIEAGETIVMSQVTEIGEHIAMDLARVEAQARSITQTVPMLDSDEIDRVLPGLVDQYGDVKVFGGGIWPLPDVRTPGRAKHSTFYHRDASGKLIVNTHWNSAESRNYFEEPWHRGGMQAPRGKCVWAAAYKDDASAEPRTNCAMTIYKDGSPWGVSTIDLTLGFFNRLVAEKQDEIEGEVMIVEADGKILSNQPQLGSDMVLRNVSEMSVQSPFIATVQKALASPSQALRREVFTSKAGEEFSFFMTPVEGTPWFLAAALPTAKLEARSTKRCDAQDACIPADPNGAHPARAHACRDQSADETTWRSEDKHRFPIRRRRRPDQAYRYQGRGRSRSGRTLSQWIHRLPAEDDDRRK